MNSKGFTFEQMATLILVIMGLTVAVVLAATQLSKSGSQLSQLGSQSGQGVEQAAGAAGSLGTSCIATGGYCLIGSTGDTPCGAGYTFKTQEDATPYTGDDCGATKGCCVPN